MRKFAKVHNRKQTRSVKWDMLTSVFKTDDVLPMWIADMDFKSPQAVNNALMKRVEHGIYGYTNIDNDVVNAVVNWLQKQHQWEINSDWLTFSPSVITSLHAAIQAFTHPKDKVLIQPPVYTPFYDIIELHDRTIVKSPLVLKDNQYEIDFEHFESKLKQGVRAFILCSPHNPGGRVWKKEELTKIANLCVKYNVLIISDEIHSDLTYTDVQHIPIASLSNEIEKNTITLMSPTKTFNLAGLQASYMIISDKEKRDKAVKQLNKQGASSLNTLAITALEAAYTQGESWLNELLVVLEEHKQYVEHMLETKTDELKVVRSEGTYLLWIDCRGLEMNDESLHEFMVKEAKVGLNQGIGYGEEGKQFMRINIACPKETLEDGINRIITAVNNR